LLEEIDYAKGPFSVVGWLHEIRTDGKKLVLVMSDKSGVKELVLNKEDAPPEILEIPKGSHIVISGSRESPLKIERVDVVSRPDAEWPIDLTKINDHSDIELVKKRHLYIRSPRMIAVLKIQSEILRAAREFLDSEGFIEILPPVISTATDPGLRGAKIAEIDFYGSRMKLMGSMMLHKQMAVAGLEKVYAVSPNIRLEPEEAKETGRHLSQFYQIDLEAVHWTYEDAMHLGEQMLVHIIRSVKERCSKELDFLKRDLRIPRLPFKRLTHKEAVDLARKLGFEANYDKEIPWEAEKAISMRFKEPFWIKDYPDASRGFYDKLGENARLKDFDLMYPEGYGEAISGSEREHTYEGVLRQMKKTGIDPKDYDWYLEMLKFGMPPIAGFGLGVERLTRFICGLQKVWEASPFPKVPGVVSP